MGKYKFIVFEGIDGSGKTVQSKKLSKSIDGYYTYEPTDGEIGKLIRRVLRGEVCYSGETLALLFANLSICWLVGIVPINTL